MKMRSWTKKQISDKKALKEIKSLVKDLYLLAPKRKTKSLLLGFCDQRYSISKGFAKLVLLSINMEVKEIPLSFKDYSMFVEIEERYLPLLALQRLQT